MSDQQQEIKELEAREKEAIAEMQRAIIGVADGSYTLEQASEAIRARGRAGVELRTGKLNLLMTIQAYSTW